MNLLRDLTWGFLSACGLIGAAYGAEPRLGDPVYSGTGCGYGSVSTALSPDFKALSVLFSEFVAEAGGDTGLGSDRKSCILRVPVIVPAGVSIALTQAEYRGFQALPDRGYGQFTVQFGMAQHSFPRFNRRFVGPLNEDFYALNRLHVRDVKWSNCSRTESVVPVDLNVSFVVATNGKQEQTIAALDSQEINSSVDFGLRFKDCAPGR